MKFLLIAKRFSHLLALILCISMLLSACGNNEEVSSSNISSEEDTPITTETSSVVDEAQNSSSGAQQTNTSTTSATTNTSSTGSKVNYVSFDNANEANIWKNVPNKKPVKILMWRAYTKTEQLLIDQYEKLTGVDVQTTIMNEEQYNTKLISMVAAGNSPDVVRMAAENFPGYATKALQPLDDTYFKLKSDCWNKTYLDAFSINGRCFGVAMPSSWSCEDCTNVTYYLPPILRACGITTMPYDLYKQGKWNWETQSEMIYKIKSKGGFIPYVMLTNDLTMLSAGVDFVTYDGKKFTNTVKSTISNESTLVSAWNLVAKLKTDNCLGSWEMNSIQQSKVAIFSSISYGLYNEGEWFDKIKGGVSEENIQAVPMAGPAGGTAYTPVRPKTWGVPKGSANPDGAAYFLRYYLDVSSFDQSKTFHNPQFEEVFKKVTSPSAKKKVMYGSGVVDYIVAGNYQSICTTLAATTPQNITTELTSKSGSIQTAIKRANKDLENIK